MLRLSNRVTRSAFASDWELHQRKPALFGNRFLARYRGDDFVKARIGAQRIPKRQKLQLTIGDAARGTDGDSQLLAGEVFGTDPSGDHCQILDHGDAIDCIFFHWQKLDCAPAFAQCFLFTPQTGIDQTKNAQRWTVIWLLRSTVNCVPRSDAIDHISIACHNQRPVLVRPTKEKILKQPELVTTALRRPASLEGFKPPLRDSFNARARGLDCFTVAFYV
jgi:hypothetical protein